MRIRLQDGRTLQLVPASCVRFSALTAFYVDSYPNRAISLAENWTWLYNGISTTNTNRWPLVAIDKDGTVVGHISSYPIQVCHAAARYNAAWFVDLYVLPDYRAVGLANILWQEVMQAADIMLSISPNKVSLPMFLKSGWIDISGAYYFSLPLNLQRNQHFSRKKEYTLLGLLGYIWRILYATRASFHEQLFHIERPSWNLFEKYFSNNNVVDNSLQIVRDETFFRWRIEQCSIGGDIFIQAKSGENSAIFTHDGGAALHYDNAVKFETTSTGVSWGTTRLRCDDNGMIELGTGQDLKIYHDASSSTDRTNILNSTRCTTGSAERQQRNG